MTERPSVDQMYNLVKDALHKERNRLLERFPSGRGGMDEWVPGISKVAGMNGTVCFSDSITSMQHIAEYGPSEVMRRNRRDMGVIVAAGDLMSSGDFQAKRVAYDIIEAMHKDLVEDA